MEQIAKENVFEQKAQTILTYLKSHLRYDGKFLPRPFFLEFTGSPSAGKTTTITELDKFLRRQGFRVLRPQEGAEVIRHIGRDTPLYIIRTGIYALTQLIDFSAGHPYDVVIFDRCIFDAYCWMLYWLEKGKLSEEEGRVIQVFFLSRFWAGNIDAAYFMICEPEVAAQRELRIALSRRLGDTTSPQSVRSLVERYKHAYGVLSADHKQLFLVDTTHMHEETMVRHIATQTLDILEQKSRNNSGGA